jgi:HD-GYP domain-containing protein (c-di-GMP phosphodiesterase class II)
MSQLHAVPTAVTDLEIGMFVTALDRPWIETPFLVEGFYITSQADIDEVEKYCRFVYVDVYRSRLGAGRRNSRVVGAHKVAVIPLPQEPALETIKFRQRSATAIAELFPHRKLKPFEDTSSFGSELAAARPVYAEVLRAYKQMMDAYRAGGRLDISGVREVVNPMVESVIRNPDACVWLACSKDEQSYTWGHSAGASVWAVALGRQLGLPRADLQRLAMGALLLDVGKLKVPEDLLLKRERLTPGEFQLIKSHVEFGLEMLEGTGILSRSVTDMLEFHHERHGGHGYPRGIGGNDIPVFGRIAAIVDCYDAITSRRPYAPPMSPSNAVKKLYAWRDIDFDALLVEEFIQAIGIYPAGTLVELSNGEVGVATAGYRTRRLRPQLLLVLDRDKRPCAPPRPLDLLTVTHDEDGKPLEIATSLEPGSFGVDPVTLVV